MPLKYFFANPNIVPSSLKWHAYGMEHLILLFIIFVFNIFMCKKFVKLSAEQQNKLLKFFAILIVFQEILKDILHFYAGTLNLEHLPLHLCGISIFITFWYAFKPGKVSGEYLYALSLPGALAALLFPNWTEYPMMHFSNINSFTIHTWLVVFVTMLLYSGRLKPDFRNLPKTSLLIGILAVPIYFINKLWDTNFMFLNGPSKGSPLVFLYDIFGGGYLIALIVLVLSAWLLMYLPWEVIYRKKANRESEQIA